MKYEELINFLDRVKGKVYEIQLTGGEPMAHPHFKEISKYATENFQEVTMTTTGHLINSKSIIYLKGMSYIQISLYHHNPILNDQITNGKDTLNKTIRGIRFLNNENLDYSVTNIVRNSLIDEFDNFIEFLILNQVK
ncbi:TPA: radical SAM protein, partial [Streptococcus suis]